MSAIAPTSTRHAIVRGRVQGVGFRLWVESEARRRGLDGWVRNRRDGTVELVVSGDQGKVEAMLAALRHGPSGASVTGVEISPHAGSVAGGFEVLPTE